MDTLPSELIDSWQFLVGTSSPCFSVAFEESLIVVDLWYATNLCFDSQHCDCNDIEHVGSSADCMGNSPTDGLGDPGFVRSILSNFTPIMRGEGSNFENLYFEKFRAGSFSPTSPLRVIIV